MPPDKFTKKAHFQGYAARSVFKLKDIQRQMKVIKEGDAVLDLGASPGSWSQFAKELGADVTAIDLATIRVEGIKKIKGDIFETEFEEVFDVILSDLAPKTTGMRSLDAERSYDLCMKALDLTKKNLKKNGKFVVKIFQSGFFEQFRKEMTKRFEKVKTIKPEASKKRSKEIYLIGIKKKPLFSDYIGK